MGGLRVLIMCADPEHLSAARSLAAQLEDRSDVEAVGLTEDLSVLGGRFGAVMAGAKAPGKVRTLALAARGHGVLARTIREFRADVVVCEPAALAATLGQLKRLGRFPLGLISLQVDPAELEDLSEPGTPVAVQPLVDPRLLDSQSRSAARAYVARQCQITLKGGRSLVLISGGLAGSGDLAGAVQTSVDSVPEAAVLVVCGQNADAESELAARFADTPAVRVIGTTDRMPTLLTAADVFVHAPGGVSEIEARLTGCPLVSFGADLGPALERALADGRRPPLDVTELPRAADVVMTLAR